MTTILFIFALLTTPSDKYICTLWTKALTQENIVAACGIDLLEGLRVDVTDLNNTYVCSMDAIYLNDISELMQICKMDKPLDHYLLRIVQPGFNEIVCFIESESEEKPDASEIRDQCPRAPRTYVIEYAGTKEPEAETPEFSCPSPELRTGFGMYDQAIDAKTLLTSEDLNWLAGQLIWNGRVKPASACRGAVNPETLIATSCGMAAARDAVIKWQNQFDNDIYNAARTYNVPAKLIKRMIRMESQFWPFYTAPAGEVGVMQVTDNGLDTLLRFDRLIDPFYFTRNDAQKLWSRSVTRDALHCTNCTLEKAIEKIKQDMPFYARIIAAFRCRAVTINPSLSGDDAWRQAIVDYNGSADYLRRVEQ